MSDLALAAGIGTLLAGAVMVAFTVRRPAINAAAVIAELDDIGPADPYSQRLAQPLLVRVIGPLGKGFVHRIAGLMPQSRVAKLRKRLVLAGLADSYTAEEFYSVQAVLAGAAALSVLVVSLLLGWSGTATGRAVLIVAPAAAAFPRFRLNRAVESRRHLIRRDLPDILDLLAISVEAGVGLEGAFEVVTKHFDSPLATEMARMLREMELGLARREALQNLRARTDIPDVSNFIVSLLQADALGMPLGRVLRIQADEMRSKRRQWARERAAKLPVKILFPLLAFILPALFVVVLGPAVSSIISNVLGS
jgi:tight adherence protein C